MEDEANARLNLLRTDGRSVGHDEGVTTRSEEEEDLDLARLQRGISYFRHNFFSMFVAMLTGLLTLMYVETIAAVLEATKRSGSAPLSFSRYLSTLNHTLAWYKVTSPSTVPHTGSDYIHVARVQLTSPSPRRACACCTDRRRA